MATIIDGKAVAKEVQKQIKARSRRAGAPLGHGARVGGGAWSATIRRRIFTFAIRKRPARKSASNPSSICSPRRSRKENCWRWCISSTRTSRFTASWCNCRCRRIFTRKKFSKRSRRYKDVDGFHPVNQGNALARRRRLSAVYADGHHEAVGSGGLRSQRQKRRGGRPQQYRRQTGGAHVARKARHGDDLPFADRESARRSGPRRYSRRRHRQGRHWCAATGSSPARW